MYRHTRFQQKVSERRGWGGKGEERREGSMADQESGGRRRPGGGGGGGAELIGKRKFGRITHKLSFGEQLGILVEKEKEEEEEGESEKGWSSSLLERQDSELSTFSEMDLDEFYVEETPPEESEVEEEGAMEGFQEEQDDEEDIFEAKTEKQEHVEKIKEEAARVRRNASNWCGVHIILKH